MKNWILLLFILNVRYLPGQEVPPCDTTANCCDIRCGENISCLCDCLLATGKDLRESEQFDQAVKYLQAVEQLCPGRNARALIDSIYQEHRIWVYGNGKFAIATPLGEPITSFKFSNPEPFRKGVAIFSENGRYYFVDKEGEVLTPYPGFDGIIQAEESKYYLIKGDENSIFEFSGQHSFKWMQNRKLSSFAFSLVELSIHQEKGLMEVLSLLDWVTDSIFKPKADIIWSRESSKWGLKNVTKNEFINEPKYDYFWPYTEGFALVNIGGRLSYDYYSRVVPSDYRFSVSFDPETYAGENYCLYNLYGNCTKVFCPPPDLVKGGIWILIDGDGFESLQFSYDRVWKFKNGFALFEEGGKLGLFNQIGEIVIASDYNSILYDEESGFFRVSRGGKWGVIDLNLTDLNEVVALKYEFIGEFRDGLAVVNSGGKWNFIDMDGIEVINPRFDFIVGEKEPDFYVINESGRIDFFNYKDGSRTIDFFVTNFFRIGEYIYFIFNQDKMGLFFSDSRTYIPPEYDEIAQIHDPWVMVMKDGKWGWVDHSGNVMIPCRYDAATPFNEYSENGYATVFQFGLQFRINTKGEMIWRKE